MESIIDREHDFKMVTRLAQAQDVEGRVEQLIMDVPTITIKGLAEKTGRTDWEIRKAVQKLGYHRSRGGLSGSAGWTKTDVSTIKPNKPVTGPADVNFDEAA
jgi:hypothetical protein